MNLESFYQRVINPPSPWTVSKVEISDDSTRVDVWLIHQEHYRFSCHACHTPSPTYDHAPERTWQHLDTCECKTYLHARIPRVQCPKHGIVNSDFPLADSQISITYKMESKCIKTIQASNLTDASGLTRVSWDMLESIRDRAVKRGLERRGDTTPVIMGLDEKQVFSRHRYFTIITDIGNGSVFDVVDKRRVDDISPWFEKRKESLQNVQIAAMDMSAGYERIASNFMPNAELCFDHFHVMQVVQKAVDSTRKQEQATMSDEDKKSMFGARHDFLYGRENLPDKNKARFEKVRQIAKKTARAWAIKENLRDMWTTCPDKEETPKYFKHWYWWATHSQIPDMAKAAHTLKNHFCGIVAAIEHGVSNALTEGLNSKIEAVKRSACGFKNKESLRNAILFHCGKLNLLPEAAN